MKYVFTQVNIFSIVCVVSGTEIFQIFNAVGAAISKVIAGVIAKFRRALRDQVFPRLSIAYTLR
ncbi:MAG: hypothetical protein WCP92_04445 [bacterium]